MAINDWFGISGRGGGGKSGNSKKGRKGGGRGDADSKDSKESFSVPKSLEFNLAAAPLDLLDVLPLRFLTEFVWLFDFAITSTIG